MTRLPRVVIAAAASGQGKTTVAVGIMAALRSRGLAVAPAKVGPDYIDPGYHALATGRPGRNLDPWLTAPEQIAPLLLHGARTPYAADLSVIEGVMGLYDGQMGTDGFASTAHVATLTHSPVLLVIDISSAARTIAASVHGLASYDPSVQVAGVVLNKAGSARHATEVRRAVEATGLPVLGVLPRDAGVSVPSRHLGLVPAAERDEAAAGLDRLAGQITEHLDLDAVLELARTAPDLHEEPWAPPTVHRAAPARVVAVAGGQAFTFRYTETDEILRAAGCEPVVFDPASDPALPAGTSGLYLGGGFPEAHAPALARNASLLAELRDAVASGMPTVAECAGLLYLAQALDDHAMVGALPAAAAMHPRLTLGYRTATLPVDGVLGVAGTTVHAHEFHRTRTTPATSGPGAWLVDGAPAGFALDPAGTGRPTVHASYLHVHWAGNPSLATSFADAVHTYQPAMEAVRPPVTPSPVAAYPAATAGPTDPLDHHGDAELRGTGRTLVDLAVNVRVPVPPVWLTDRIAACTTRLAAYPDVSQARTAIAERHGVPEAMVLPTSGAAEAFTLIARAVPGRHPLVVHPQFTEPEAALRRVGRVPERHVLHADAGFVLDAARVDPNADLVMLGNPTNPTGVLHPHAPIESLLGPGRTVVVDEAFMDAVPGEPNSLIGAQMPGLLVLRSLTKTWGLAGLRAGYVVGDPDLIALLAHHQPPWSVSTPAAVVMTATATRSALDQADGLARQATTDRAHLVRGLRACGLRPVDGVAPFVLVQAPPNTREALRDNGFAVRRGDTFPGLDARWIRIAVRDTTTTDAFLVALDDVLARIPSTAPELAR
ncbi:cobyrinate a,c-diamide synthase [Allobranchiibius sp. CTAmp26]|uniref:cobyrinate a,c-diamide synthase n=1 Tax=Allobranchiibius sp. CTAmp26 TaxID=2815214 RepID=UPI001AA0CC0E|nr:cobyrinate a,c-diamide synthase [Allobranchiibius sp. CTAmp26]MBO1756773.1 cobyrinate a,c-diamide synthase [Allobranchiibius sp. CTAmp26]